MAFKVLFVVATYYNLDINQMNIKITFLYGFINQLIDIKVPKGFETQTITIIVCKLLKALYGLKQISKLWYKRLSKFFLEKLGFQQINVDHNIFISLVGINRPIFNTLINDIKIIEVKDSYIIMRVKQKLITVVKIAHIELINFYLYLKITQNWCNGVNC